MVSNYLMSAKRKTLAGAAMLVLGAVAVLPAAHAQVQPPVAHGPASVADLAEGLLDAVVNISTSQNVRGRSTQRNTPRPSLPDGSPFQEFFDEFFNDRGGDSNRGGQRRVQSLGSGFVIDAAEGIVITNNHVIADADEIEVNFADGGKLRAELVGTDPQTDIAVLKVDPSLRELTQVDFGDSTAIRIGDWVMAIGNPFGLGGSVTVGVISAKQRDINAGPYDDFLQTDASINKGNSGGPLFNMEGEVVGVNTAIFSPTGGSIGIGFAVPSDTVTTVINQLKQYGEVKRGWLGVKIQSITEDIAENLGLPENIGALVAGVTPESPASKGGLTPGDVIVRFDGKDITTMRGLPRIVAQTEIGKSVDVEVLRQGKRETLKIAVGLLDEGESAPQPVQEEKPAEPPPEATSVIGLTLLPLTDDMRTRFGFNPTMKGAIITEIDPESPAATQNVRVGDVITEAQHEAVSQPSDIAAVAEKVNKAGGKSVLLLVEDAKGDARFVSIPF